MKTALLRRSKFLFLIRILKFFSPCSKQNLAHFAVNLRAMFLCTGITNASTVVRMLCPVVRDQVIVPLRTRFTVC